MRITSPRVRDDYRQLNTTLSDKEMLRAPALFEGASSSTCGGLSDRCEYELPMTQEQLGNALGLPAYTSAGRCRRRKAGG